MRYYILILLLAISSSVISQQTVWQQNQSFVDSLISMYRLQSKCSLTNSTLTKESKKKQLDIKLVNFLNKFYFGGFEQKGIEETLKKEFRQTPWGFDQIHQTDSFTVYEGRIRSFGNFEPFISYIILNNKIIATHITIRIRSTLDCIQFNDRSIPDLLYLSKFIPERINFPFEKDGWTEYFHSKIWMKSDLSIDIREKLKSSLGKN